MVDGQHRLEGLKMASEKDERVLDFAVPVNIAANLPRIQQMCHFYVVNTTQKSVDQAVGQRIIARITRLIDVEEVPTLPKWIKKLVDQRDVKKAVDLVDFLNSEPGSPWEGKIKMVNETGTKRINQASFVKAINRYVFVANNPIAAYGDFDKEKHVFLNYWKAISGIIDDEEQRATTLYKYNGVNLFCHFSTFFFTKLQDKGDFTSHEDERSVAAVFRQS